MNLFLKAKHWQVFLATFGLPIMLEIIMMASIFASFAHNSGKDVFNLYFRFFPFIMLLFMGTLFGWLWSVAIGLQKMVPPEVKMKVTKFKIFFFIPVIYILLICLFIGSMFGAQFSPDNQSLPLIFSAFAIIVPVHLFSMFCIFYCLYFVAKIFKTVELQRPVTFSDFMGEFFMIWFHFIGVWVLQPKINKMIEKYEAGLPQIDIN
jgi:hypothetical protein